jgi:hypothetical protein
VGIAETWVITAQVFDTAGQASELLVEVVQVSEDEGLGPAFIEGQFIEPRVNVAEMAVNHVNFRGLAGIGSVISAHDVLSILVEGVEDSPEEPDASDLSECLKLTVAPVGQGCTNDFCSVDVSIEVMCEVTSPPGEEVLLFLTGEYLPEAGNASFLDTSGWNQSGRSTVPSGSRFEIRDSRQCGASAIYSAILAYGNYPDSNIRTTDKAEVVHTLPPCPQDAISANITLTAAESHPGGALVRYQFNPAGNWSAQLPAGQVDMKIYGHTSDHFEVLGWHEFTLPGDSLPGYSDEVVLMSTHWCDSPIFFTFLGTHNSAEIFRVTTTGMMRPCPNELLTNIPIELEMGNIYNQRYLYLHYRFDIPAGVAWPEGNDVFIGMLREGDTLGRTLHGGIMITNEIRQRGYSVEERDYGEGRILCGLNEYRYFLVLAVDGRFVDLGSIFTITTPPCSP